MNTSSVPPSPGGPRSPLPNLSIKKVAIGRAVSNGLSFDSDKGEFKEFVDVGIQTCEKSSTVSSNNKSNNNHLIRDFPVWSRNTCVGARDFAVIKR